MPVVNHACAAMVRDLAYDPLLTSSHDEIIAIVYRLVAVAVVVVDLTTVWPQEMSVL